MKVLGLFSGRHGQNSEFLCKTALRGAADSGADVAAINLLDLELKPCVGCKGCHDFRNVAVGECVLKDDYAWLDEQLMEADALLVVMPIYEKTVPGEFKIVMDRFGPSHDIAFRQWAKEQRAAKDYGDGKTVGERSLKQRPAVLIAHGGTDWGGLALPVMKLWAIPMGLNIVDELYYPWNLQLPFEQDRIDRVYASGRHLAECAEDPGKASYIGAPGHCPVCHSREMILGDNDEVECCVCGIKGTLSFSEGKIKLCFPQEQLSLSQMGNGGREKHLRDLLGFGKLMATIDREAMGRIKKEAVDWLPLTKP